MQRKQFEQIKQVNYWQALPSKRYYVRQDYLNAILDYLDNNLIKVLVGQRRCGKSTILKQIINKLVANDAPQNNILYLNFELHELHWIKTYKSLINVIEAYYEELKPSGKVYIFLDEIQEIDAWEKVVNSFLANDHYEIEFFLTGSNANLLSTELSTYVTGRYIEIPIFPFSFAEFCDYNKMDSSKETLINYLDSSGMPELFKLSQRQQKISYLNALKDSILMNDIVKRFNIKNAKLLVLLFDFLIDNIGKLFSINTIAKKLATTGIKINAITLGNYIQYLELTFVIHCARRYDLKGKKILEGERKYYLNDLGLSNYLQSSFDNNITRRLENYVYIALLQAGYQVHVGRIYQREVDFIAEKDQQLIYIQVTYLLHTEEVTQREYGSLEKIPDNWPKWVVSLDDVSLPTKNGIRHIQAWTIDKHLD